MTIIHVSHPVHYEKVFKACSSKYQGDGPTGILLVYPQHCVHLLEAPMEIIRAILHDLKELDFARYVILLQFFYVHKYQCKISCCVSLCWMLCIID